MGLAFITGAAVLAACAEPMPEPAATPAPPDPRVVRTAIEALGQQYKAYILNGDSRGIASMFAQNGRFEVYGFPSLSGPKAIAAALGTTFQSAKYKLWDVTYGDIGALSADVAVAGGTTHQITELKGKELHGWYRWVAAYKKGADGQYRIEFLTAFPDSTK